MTGLEPPSGVEVASSAGKAEYQLCSRCPTAGPAWVCMLSLLHRPALWVQPYTDQGTWEVSGGQVPMPAPQTPSGVPLCEPKMSGLGSTSWGPAEQGGFWTGWGGRGAGLQPVGHENGLRDPLRTPRSGEHVSQKRPGWCGPHPRSQGPWGEGAGAGGTWMGHRLRRPGTGTGCQG